MQIKWNLGNIKLYAGIARTEVVEGFNSKLPDGNHFLMWDFDDVGLGDVKEALEWAQAWWHLPPVYIFQSSANGWHANCFKAYPWLTTRTIIAATPLVDKKFLGVGMLREFFTLRYTPIGDNEIEPVFVLSSEVPEDISPYELTSFARYRKHSRGLL